MNEDEKENEDANGGKDGDAYAFDLTSPTTSRRKNQPRNPSRRRVSAPRRPLRSAARRKSPKRRRNGMRRRARPRLPPSALRRCATTRASNSARRPIHDRRRSRPPTRVRDRSENRHRRHPARRRPRRDRDVTTVAAVRARALATWRVRARPARRDRLTSRATPPPARRCTIIHHTFIHHSPSFPPLPASSSRLSRSRSVSSSDSFKRYRAAARRVPRASRAFDMLALARAA